MRQRRGTRHAPLTHSGFGAWHAVAGTGIGHEITVLLELWRQQPHSQSTEARLGELISRFGTRLEATGVASLTDASIGDCDEFVWAPTRRGRPPSLPTVHLRRTALHDLFGVLRDLDPAAIDPSADITLPDKRGAGARPLTDGEIDLVRVAALGRGRHATRTALVVAFCEATATTSEVPQLRWHHIDMDTGSVKLPGATPIRARIGHLSAWGLALTRNISRDLCDDTPVIGYAGNGAAHSQQASMSNLLARLLTNAGVHGPRCKPGSIRLWGAQQQLTAHGIEAAARALGIESLDATATALGHHWQDT